MLLIVHGFVIALLLALGVVFRRGKGAFLIAGYNTAPKAEKETVNEKKLCRYTGNLMFVLAGCWSVAALSEIFQMLWLLWLGYILFFIAVIAGIICINTGNRLKK